MVIPIIPKATVGELAPRRTFRGRLAANRQLRGVAIVAALVLALVASLAIGRALQADQVGGVASLAPVDRYDWEQAERTQTGGAVVPGFIELHEDQRPPVTVAAPALAAAYTGACRSDVAGCVPEERLIPGVPVPTTPVGTGRQQAELYAIEVRDNGAGTTGGDSGSCREPGRSCDR